MSRWKNILQTSDELYRLKRAAVLREAMRIIGRRGYHDSSLDDIASALQVSKGTLYNYVRDKQEILFECHMLSLDVGEAAFRFADMQAGSGLTKLRLMLYAYIVWMNGPDGGGGVVTEIGALRPADRKIIVKRRDLVDKRLTAYMNEGVADGSMKAVDGQVAVCAIMGAINTIPVWYSPKGRLPLEQIAIKMVRLLIGTMENAADDDWGTEAIALMPYSEIADVHFGDSGRRALRQRASRVKKPGAASGTDGKKASRLPGARTRKTAGDSAKTPAGTTSRSSDLRRGKREKGPAA